MIFDLSIESTNKIKKKIYFLIDSIRFSRLYAEKRERGGIRRDSRGVPARGRGARGVRLFDRTPDPAFPRDVQQGRGVK